MDNIERYIVTFFFIVGVGLFSVFSFLNTKESICEVTADMSVESVDDIDANISKIDDAIIEGVVGRYKLVEAYGQIAKLLGKHEVNGFEYVIDKNGFLSLGNFWNDGRINV